MNLAHRIVPCAIGIDDGDCFTSHIQIPNGATKLTIQFFYSSIDADVTCTLQQSLDGTNFDNIVSCVLDHDDTTATLNVVDVLTTWIRFEILVGSATTGVLSRLHLLMS
ncbi:MAG: hypothetical protein EOM90_16720 [Alphaproteobacteria bacterium]|nr:hypothetical protein [Alphaproteobacteria bacterium]